MRRIEPTLPDELIKKGYDPKKIFSSQALSLNRYTELVEYNAKIAYLNKDYLLFYRGQCQIIYLNLALQVSIPLFIEKST